MVQRKEEAAVARAEDNVVAAVGDDAEELTAEDSAVIDTVVSAVGPLAMRFGFSGGLGLCTGYAIKQASKIAAMCLGVGFVCLQSLQYAGYIEVKWGKIKSDMASSVSTDGSGKVTIKDVRHYTTKLFRVLRYHGPGATGFSTGLYIGMRQ